MKIKKIWFVTREYDGLAGAGGVKDVCRQLAEALAHDKAKVRVVLPCYGFIDPQLLGYQEGMRFALTMNYPGQERIEEVRVWSKKERLPAGGQVTIHLLASPRFQEKQGVYTYTAAEEARAPWQISGSGHIDYFAMNVLLQKAALAMMIQGDERPDIIHCHDGHTALIPALARQIDGFRHFFSKTGFVVTIHNAGIGYHQEIADLAFAQAITGLPQSFIHKNLLDGKFDPFIAAAGYATLNTVSENYAHELRSTDADALTGWLGHFLMSRGVMLHGITNGIDPATFATTNYRALHLAAPYSVAQGDLAGKATCRARLVADISAGNLAVDSFGTLESAPTQPLFTFIGRFSAQKGVDVLVKALHGLLAQDDDFQVLVLGSGQANISQGIKGLAADSNYKGRVCLLEGYDQPLASQVFAAGDFFIIPSQFEPCGLTDFMAQLYGNLPIVHHVGGLVKVVDGETGFAYKTQSPLALQRAMKRALRVFRQDPAKLTAMGQQAVATIMATYTWDKVVKHYQQLYQEARRATSCH